MKIVHCKTTIRRKWHTSRKARGLVMESDIGFRHGRLRAKLVVFDTLKNLRNFWRTCLKLSSIPRAYGAVNSMSTHFVGYDKHGNARTERIEVDARYFCIIGLCRRHLGMETISHEAVHAAYAYAKRQGKTPWDTPIERFDEEKIAYPAGIIAATINEQLHRAGMYS
jgi:hypothetical protein